MTQDMFNCKTIVIDRNKTMKKMTGIFLFSSKTHNDINFSTEGISGVLDTSNAIISDTSDNFTNPKKAWILERPGSLYYLLRGNVAMMPMSVPVCLEDISDECLPRKTQIMPQLSPEAKDGFELLRFLLPRYERIPFVFRGNITVLYDGEVKSLFDIDDKTYIRTLYIEAPKDATISISDLTISIV